MPVSDIGQPEVLQVLSPIWTEKHETARRVAQRMKAVLDVAHSRGFREGENPVTIVQSARVLPRVKAKVKHHDAMDWRDVPAFYAKLSAQSGMAAKALMFTCLTGCRTSEVLQAVWSEIDFDKRIWVIPDERTKTDTVHRVPLTVQMLKILEPLRALRSDCVFEGQRRHKPLSNMSMLMLLRRMGVENVTVHGFRSAFRDWASKEGNVAREVAELSLGHKVGTEVERAYARSDLLERRRDLMEKWSLFCSNSAGALQ